MTINLVGDLCLHNISQKCFTIEDKLARELARADLNVANLESPLSHREDANHDSVVNLLGEPVYGPILKWFNVVSLANNHILDYREAGYRDTIGFLRGHNISYFGFGDDLASSFQPLRLTVAGEKTAFIGATRWNNATMARAGTTPIHLKRLSQEIRQLKSDGYFTIVYPHWNYEYVDYPAPDYRSAAKKLIDAGADLVVASHPHVVQGYESYRGKMVFHSLGNFIFHQAVFEELSPVKNDPRLKLSFVLQIEVSGQQMDYSVIPIGSESDSVRMLNGAERDVFLQQLARISQDLSRPGVYPRAFYLDALAISNHTSRMLKMLARKKGLMSLLRTLPRAKKQDIKIKLASLRYGPGRREA